MTPKRTPGAPLVIGAGPAGLAAALELAEGGRRPVVLERSTQVGGLAKTYRFEEGARVFLADNGPHHFYTKNARLQDWVGGLIDQRWRRVPRQSRQFLGGAFYEYPIQPTQVLRRLGAVRCARILADYGAAAVSYGLRRQPLRSFQDYVVANFGRSLGRLCFLAYTEKVWGRPADEIHAALAQQRIRGVSLGAMLRSALIHGIRANPRGAPRTLLTSFYYPEGGSGRIYEAIRLRLEHSGHEVHTDSCPLRFEHDGRRIKTVHASLKGREVTFHPSHVVESVPLGGLLGMFHPAPPIEVTEAASRLPFRSQVYLFVTLDKTSMSSDQWTYFPDAEVPFGRVSEMKNFCPSMSPADKTSAFIEFFCTEGDRTWNMSAAELLEMALPHLGRAGFLKRTDVRETYVLRARNVYPVYSLDYEDNLQIVLDYLGGFENLLAVGRPGRFCYTNQDHSIEMGIEAARAILRGASPDLERCRRDTGNVELARTSPRPAFVPALRAPRG